MISVPVGQEGHCFLVSLECFMLDKNYFNGSNPVEVQEILMTLGFRIRSGLRLLNNKDYGSVWVK